MDLELRSGWCRWRVLAWGVGMLCVLGQGMQAAELPPSRRFPKDQIKTGSTFLAGFSPVSKMLQKSVVKLDVAGSSAALGMVVDGSGLVLTKASEVRRGPLTAWLHTGKEVSAKILVTDEQNDVALVQVQATGLKPIAWPKTETQLGQWMITPGTDTTPLAVGVLSVPPRRIYPKRAFIGIQLDLETSEARISEIMKGYGAEKAGMKSGDRVVSLNGRKIQTRKELMDQLREFRAGQKVDVKVKRGESELDFTVALMEAGADLSPGRMDREERMNRMGSDLSERAEGFDMVLQHDTVLQAWQCGGPVVDLDGRVVGMNIARAGRVATYALPVSLVRQISERLKSMAKSAGSRSSPS